MNMKVPSVQASPAASAMPKTLSTATPKVEERQMIPNDFMEDQNQTASPDAAPRQVGRISGGGGSLSKDEPPIRGSMSKDESPNRGSMSKDESPNRGSVSMEESPNQQLVDPITPGYYGSPEHQNDIQPNDIDQANLDVKI
jgi:hypothetical protein